MTLPGSGSISIAQMRDEYGMGNPVSMNQFYGKPGIQGSGALSFSNFHGQSNITVSWSHEAGTYSKSGSPGVNFQLSCSQVATWTWTRSGSGLSSPGNGGSSTVITFTVTAINNNSRTFGTFYVTGTSHGVSRSWILDL